MNATQGDRLRFLSIFPFDFLIVYLRIVRFFHGVIQKSGGVPGQCYDPLGINSVFGVEKGVGSDIFLR